MILAKFVKTQSTMKKLLLTVLSFAALFATSCQRDSISNPLDPVPFSGTWKVIHYNVNEEVKTGEYHDYIFDFKPKQAISATIGGQESNGYWAMSGNGERKFSIAFNNGDGNLSALNDKWDILAVNELEVQLEDREGGRQIYFARQ